MNGEWVGRGLRGDWIIRQGRVRGRRGGWSVGGRGLLWLVGGPSPGGRREDVNSEACALYDDDALSGTLFLGLMSINSMVLTYLMRHRAVSLCTGRIWRKQLSRYQFGTGSMSYIGHMSADQRPHRTH